MNALEVCRFCRRRTTQARECIVCSDPFCPECLLWKVGTVVDGAISLTIRGRFCEPCTNDTDAEDLEE